MSSLDNMQFNNVLPAEYKLEEVPIAMDAATEYEWHEIQSDNLAQPQATNWRLQLKNLNVLVNPAKAYLEVQGRMTNDGFVDLTGNEETSIQNHILSLFSRATLRVGGQIVETVNECNVAKGLVQPLLHYSQDYASSSATNEMFYKDTGDFTAPTTRLKYTHALLTGDAQAADALNISDNVAYNEGYAKRYVRTNNKNFTAWVPLSALFGFCSVNRVLTNNTFIVELTRSAQRDHILTATGEGRVSVGKVSIWMPNILPKSVVDLSLKSAFADGLTSDYVFPQMQSYSFTATSGAGASVDNLRIATSSEKVLYCFVILRNGNRGIANSVAQTSDTISTLELRLNGRSYPQQSYVSLEGDSDDKARAYSDVLRYMSKGYDFGSGTPLSYDEWTRTTIYAFDMTSQPESFAGAPATIELRASSTGAGLASREWSVCVMTEKRCQISYTGQSSVVLVN